MAKTEGTVKIGVRIGFKTRRRQASPILPASGGLTPKYGVVSFFEMYAHPA